MSVNGELLVIAISIVALGAAGILSSSAHAEEDCLAAPSGRPPPGSQWHYRTNHLKQRKCWHLRAQGEERETGAATATRPGAERPPNPPAHLEDQKFQTVPEATAGLRGSTAPASIQDGGAGPPATLPWPDPPSPAAADNTAWPDPPSPTHASNVVWPDPPAPILADKAKELKAPMLDRNSGGDVGSVKQVAAEMAATSYSKMSIGVLLLCAIGLVIAGILVRRWVIITSGRRPSTDLAQRAPRRRQTGAGWTANVADDETRRTLQKLLQVLERQAVRT
jgi:hypothetical protein